MPRIHRGLIGSANVLLKDAQYRDELRDRLGVRAIEMEGSGVADGAWLDGVGYLVIRGICDYCDGNKNDLWQGYAALAAAAYARAVLEVLPATAPR
jgi:nucleoside phosphorylase